jgi:HAD superfamily hydrolase (TIGR01509 family)
MLVIFDCDGVLVDSEIISARVDSELLARLGFEINPQEVALRFAGYTTEKIFREIGKEMGRAIPDDLIREAQQETDRRLGSEVEAIPGVQEMLDNLDDPRCICSNSRPERLEITLRHTGLWDRFRPYVFSAPAVGEGRGKPAPDVFLHAASVFEVSPADAVVIEDSIAGVTGAVAAGMRVIGFTGASHTWTGHSDALVDVGALTVVRRMADLAATIEALRTWQVDSL